MPEHVHYSGVCTLHVIKRRGGEEHYDIRKVYGTVYAAAIASGVLHDRHDADTIAEKVSNNVDAWIHGRTEVESKEIFEKTVECVRALNEKVAMFYESHRDLS